MSYIRRMYQFGTNVRLFSPSEWLKDTVATGLAAILGAGIFSVIAPALGIDGPALLVSFSIADSIALCNALSSTQLASAFPLAGGTYEFGRRVLGSWWDYWLGGCSWLQIELAPELLR